MAFRSPSGKIQIWQLKLNHVRLVLHSFQFINCNRLCDALTDGDLASHRREMTVRPHSRCGGSPVPVKSRPNTLRRACRRCALVHTGYRVERTVRLSAGKKYYP